MSNEAEQPEVPEVCGRCGFAPVARGVLWQNEPVCEQCWEGVLQNGDDYDDEDWDGE